MSIKKGANWYGLNMLPVYVELCEGQLDASEGQLQALLKAQSRPHVLDPETLHRIIKLHTSQNADNWVFFEQCKRWRNDNPHDEDLQLIARIEKSAHQLEAVNRHILSWVETFKDRI